jgi:catechol 2,3-dioxygenase-like lactoylglutathione lyase family enzyme
MAAEIRLGHVGIYVRDLERMVEFYRDILAMGELMANEPATLQLD